MHDDALAAQDVIFVTATTAMFKQENSDFMTKSLLLSRLLKMMSIRYLSFTYV
jgi:hypothetical protein